MQSDRHSFEWRLHPSVTFFTENSHVYVRPKSVKEFGITGRVVDVEEASKIPAHNHDQSMDRNRLKNEQKAERVSILQTTGIIKQYRTSRLVPIYDHNTKHNTVIVLTPDTANYRQLAVAHLRHGDKVFEVGCSTGACTALVLRRLLLLNENTCQSTSATAASEKEMNGQIVAFDTGSDMVQQTQQALESEFQTLSSHLQQQKLPQVFNMTSVHKIDAFVDPKGAFTMATQDDKYPNVVLIDFGGNRELEGVTRMIHWIQNSFQEHPPRAVIVKSKELVQQMINDSSGVILTNAQKWLMNYLQTNNISSSKQPPCYSHPLQAPLVMSPADDENPICRFHNYHDEGCKRYNRDKNECHFDHEYCHWCRRKGHVARECSG
jgi:hypothetical protein